MRIDRAVPCSICGRYPIMQGGLHDHSARLVCPNFKSTEMKHGSLNAETRDIPKGFTSWHFDDWWTKEQIETKGMP